MEKSDANMAAHVRSVKRWLEKAEQSYDSKSDIQGELNLMLAEAEMKNLRKNHAAGHRLLRLGAATIAVLAAVLWLAVRLPGPAAGTATAEVPSEVIPGAVRTEEVQQAEPDETRQEQYSAPADTTSTREPDQSEVSVTESATSQQMAETVPPQRQTAQEAVPVQQYTAPVSAQVLSDQQMQDAVQDARHSLRGGAIHNK
ncbi:MAG: hypothetical protein LKF74_00125 [Megasphaera sp.]|jgi:hypothetical protein|nr:hypothetical protein [Megasphaera sp.]MCH4187107.1 hypothetical protein [Megasphaera sp.]MCH4216957.1 hypothetical protein [Megasphaera sp.]